MLKPKKQQFLAEARALITSVSKFLRYIILKKSSYDVFKHKRREAFALYIVCVSIIIKYKNTVYCKNYIDREEKRNSFTQSIG